MVLDFLILNVEDHLSYDYERTVFYKVKETRKSAFCTTIAVSKNF